MERRNPLLALEALDSDQGSVAWGVTVNFSLGVYRTLDLRGRLCRLYHDQSVLAALSLRFLVLGLVPFPFVCALLRPFYQLQSVNRMISISQLATVFKRTTFS